MELLLVLLALLLFGLSAVSIRRRSRPAPPPPPRVAIQRISDPAAAHRMLIEEDADAFANRPVPPFFLKLAKKRGPGQRINNLGTVRYGPHWRALRCNITAGTLHPSRLGNLASLHREAIQDLNAALLSGDAKATVRDHLRAAVFRVVGRLCFGDGADERRVRAVCSEVHGLQVAIGMVKPFPGSSMLAKLSEWRYLGRLLAFRDRITQLCLPLIAARRQRLRDDDLCQPYVDSLIDLRVPHQDGGRRALSDDEIVDLVLEFLGAGSASSIVCLEWTLAHLVARPDVQEKLRREVDAVSPDSRSQLIVGMPYMHAVILESLRMHPPMPVALRHVKAPDTKIVLFILGDIGRDGKTWKDPDEFRPERFLPGGEAEGVGPLPARKETRMMPFGAGHRFCPGVGLAMGTIKCFLAALVREFEWEPPTDDGTVDFTELDGFLKTMKKPLAARLTRRTPSSV